MKYKVKLNGWENYLFYKKALERLRKGDCSRREIADYAGVHINSTLYMIRLLTEENVIKRISFKIDPDGTKRMIYTLIDKSSSN